MKEITLPRIDMKNTECKFRIDSNLKICVECGQSNVDYYEFGLSCEHCGSLLVFSSTRDRKKIRRYDF